MHLVSLYRLKDALSTPLQFQEIIPYLLVHEKFRCAKVAIEMFSKKYVMITYYSQPSPGKWEKQVSIIQDSHHIWSLKAWGIITDTSLKTNRKLLNTPIGKEKLTPMHLAGILNQKEILQQLIQQGCDLNGRDYLGWTVAHHVAMAGNIGLFQWLISQGADKSQLNHRGASPEQQLKLNYPASSQEELPFVQRAQHLEKKKVSFTFSRENFVDPLDSLYDWKNGSKSPLKENALNIECAYQEFRQRPPKLFIKAVTHNDKGELLPRDIGDGVFAGEDIQQGDIIDEYIGQHHLQKQVHGNYVLCHIDGEKIGSYATRFNDGKPNAIMYRIYNVGGIEERIVLFSTEKIIRGTQILINYGPFHQVKENHLELMPLALERAFKNMDFSSILKRMNGDLDQVDSQFLGELNHIKYLIDTPKSLITLLCQNSFSFIKFKEVVDHPAFSFLLKIEECSLKNLNVIYKYFTDVKTSSSLSDKMREEFLKQTLEIISKYPLSKVMKILIGTTGLLQEKNLALHEVNSELVPSIINHYFNLFANL